MGVLEANELELRLALPLADAMLPIGIPGARNATGGRGSAAAAHSPAWP
jgi:hypothetical protein